MIATGLKLTTMDSKFPPEEQQFYENCRAGTSRIVYESNYKAISITASDGGIINQEEMLWNVVILSD